MSNMRAISYGLHYTPAQCLTSQLRQSVGSQGRTKMEEERNPHPEEDLERLVWEAAKTYRTGRDVKLLRKHLGLKQLDFGKLLGLCFPQTKPFVCTALSV